MENRPLQGKRQLKLQMSLCKDSKFFSCVTDQIGGAVMRTLCHIVHFAIVHTLLTSKLALLGQFMHTVHTCNLLAKIEIASQHFCYKTKCAVYSTYVTAVIAIVQALL